MSYLGVLCVLCVVADRRDHGNRLSDFSESHAVSKKHDVQRATTEVHDYGPGRMTSEPVFVRKQGATAEDEGWIMSYVFDPKRNLSDVVILDAQDFAGEPIATIRLPVRVPFGFHGGWAPDQVVVVE